MCEEILTVLCGGEPGNGDWFGNNEGSIFLGTKKCQIRPGFRGFGASKNAFLWLLIISS